MRRGLRVCAVTAFWIALSLGPPAAALIAIWFGLATPEADPFPGPCPAALEIPADWFETHPKYADEPEPAASFDPAATIPDWWPAIDTITVRRRAKHARTPEAAAC